MTARAEASAGVLRAMRRRPRGWRRPRASPVISNDDGVGGGVPWRPPHRATTTAREEASAGCPRSVRRHRRRRRRPPAPPAPCNVSGAGGSVHRRLPRRTTSPAPFDDDGAGRGVCFLVYSSNRQHATLLKLALEKRMSSRVLGQSRSISRPQPLLSLVGCGHHSSGNKCRYPPFF